MTWSNEPDNTNLWLLTDPRYASIANYCGRDARLFKCPADRFVSGQQRSRGWTARVRSVAGNICVGGIDTYGLIESPYIVARKWSELLNPKPAETWLFMDEHPDSINDGAMYAPRLGEWIDIPANYHDGGGSIAYADGAAEIHRWQSSLRSLRVNFLFSSLPVPSNDPDLLWVRARTPKRPGFN